MIRYPKPSRTIPSRIGRIARSDTARVALGNGIGAGFGLLVLLVLSRSLGVEGYGRIAPVLTVIDLGQLLIDTILAAGVVTVASRRMGGDQGPDALRTGFVLRLVAGLIYAALFVLGGEWLARVILPLEPTGAFLLRLAGIAGGILAIQSALIGTAQIRQDFRQVAISASYKNLLRLVAVLTCLAFGWLGTLALGLALASSGLVALIATALTVGRTSLREGRYSPDAAREMLQINKWMALASVSIIASRVDIILLSAFSTPDQVAYYAAAMQLCIAIGIVSQAMVTTQLPRISRLEGRAEIRQYALSWARRAPWLLLVTLIMPLFSAALLVALMGADFRAGHRVFDLLFASSMLTMVMNPLLLVLFPLGSARLFGLTALCQVLAKWAIAWWAIKGFGATGLAWADIVTKLIAAGVILTILFNALAPKTELRKAE